MGLSREYRERTRYPEELRKRVAFEVMSGAMTKKQACQAYGISDVKSVVRAIDKYGGGILSEHKDLLEQMGRPRKRPVVEKAEIGSDEQQREIERLKKALKAAELRAEAYSMMIDIAERELKVAIRKKSGTK
jgi:transposase